MNNDNLVRMVNRIGTFFGSMPDRQEALEGIAMHIQRFWEPRMRRQLMEHIDNEGSAELTSMVAEAIGTHRSMLA